MSILSLTGMRNLFGTKVLQFIPAVVILRRMVLIYNVLLLILFPLIALFYGGKMVLTGKYRIGFAQRFGFLPKDLPARLTGKPRIWVHAVSVGEVTAAAPIIAALREEVPDASIILSTTTETGRHMAQHLVETAVFVYYPLDLFWVVRRVLSLIQPDILVLVETELWPNFIQCCRKRGVKIIMVNGRLSPRSFRKYSQTRFFWRRMLADLDEVAAISRTDAERFLFLGAPSEKVHIVGNAKYDSLAANRDSRLQEETGRLLNIVPNEKVLVAGSTHEGEEEVIISVFRRLLKDSPGWKLVIVPRHIERASSVRRQANEAGFQDVITLTEITGGRKPDKERIILVDSIGLLFKVYSLATVVFCGGSLVPKGGQNILEAAAWGKIVFYGPHMDDFCNEKNLLEGVGAGVTVHDDVELTEAILRILADPEAMSRRGQEGRRLVEANSGAAKRYAEMILGQLRKRNDT